MKVLITGASGLVGHNILDKLSQENHTLLLPNHVELDLRDYEQVKLFLQKNAPDLIVHCAGRVGGIQANINDPIAFLVENLDMGRNVIMAAYESNIKRLINLGSSCMYPRNAENPLKEEMILQGELEPTNEGYAIAKIVSQRLCSYIKRQNPYFQYKTIMPCNLYGRYDKFDPMHAHMIPSAIRKVHEAKKNGTSVHIWGSGNARREFMYAEDMADSISFAINNLSMMPDVVNVGTGKDYTINEYYSAVAEVIGFKGDFEHDLSKPEGMKQKLVDVQKINQLGWHSRFCLHDGIERTYKYFLEICGE